MRRPLIVAGAAGLALLLGSAVATALRYLRRALGQASGPGRPQTGAPAEALPGAAVDPGHLPSASRAAPVSRARSPLIAAPRFSALALVAIPAITLAGSVFFITVGAPWLLTRQHFPTPPEQPIYFSHQVHVEQAGLDCEFCHRTADRVATAGYPDVQQCMFCHGVVDDLRQATQRSAYEGQIEKLRTAWSEGEAIEWTRVHRLPDHSRFPHDAHVQAGVPCATCHGAVERMDLAYQVRSLKMADCVACHQQTGAPNQCVDCHH